MKSYKLVFIVPQPDAEKVRYAIGEIGAGIIGNYTHCSFSSQGVERFLPMECADPTIGSIGKFEEVIAERVEMTVSEEHIQAVVAKMKEVHPYEEVAYDVFERIDYLK